MLPALLAGYPTSQHECHGIADVFGDHQIGCGGNGDQISRHNAIRDVIFNAAQSAALGPSRNLVPDSSSRPADVFLPTWYHGCPAALDVHVISPLHHQLGLVFAGNSHLTYQLVEKLVLILSL